MRTPFHKKKTDSQIFSKNSHARSNPLIRIPGGSSGIGLATVNLLLSLGASVVSADLLPPVEPVVVGSPAFTFIKTDVTEWSDLLALFERAKEIHGRIDHVYANAGISPRANYLSTEVDEKGRLKEPASLTLDVNLKGVINTATLGIYYMRQQPEGGSVVISASVSSVQRFRAVDYGGFPIAIYRTHLALFPLMSLLTTR